MNRYFLNIIHKMKQVLGSKHGETLKLVNPKHEEWASIHLLTLLVFTSCLFADMPSYFLTKANKRKVRRCPKCVKEFSCRFDLANRKCLLVFLGVFAGIFLFFSKQIPFEVTRTWDCFTTWKYSVYIEMCFNNKYKYRTLHGGCF